jgi:hypothetical protein
MNYKSVSANLCKKSIHNKISPFFSHSTTFYKETQGIGGRRQRQGDIMSVGGDMMALSHVHPKYNNLIEKMVKGNTTINSSLFAMWTYLRGCP